MTAYLYFMFAILLPSISALKVTNNVNAGTKKQLKIAFATMLAHDPEDDHTGAYATNGAFLDSWGVLGESIRTHMGHLNPDLIAIVTPKVKSSRAKLIKMGWTLYEGELPSTALLRNKAHKEEVESSGCCGSAEMLKAEPLLWTQYDRVVMTDTDTLMHGSIEDLFQYNKTLIFSEGSFADEYLQASMMVFKPSLSRHREMMDIWHRGDFGSEGWDKSGIGYYYGGATVSGVLPYMFIRLHPEEGMMADPCRYNHNGMNETNVWEHHSQVPDLKLDDKPWVSLKFSSFGDMGAPYCQNFDHVKETKFSHFTNCNKPWNCDMKDEHDATEACMYFTKQWFIVKERAAAKLGQTISSQPCVGGPSEYKVMSAF